MGSVVESVTETVGDVFTLGGVTRAKEAQKNRQLDAMMKRLAPKAPPKKEDIQQADAKQAKKIRKRAQTGTRETILTSPLGVTEEGQVKKKTLLGQ